MLLACSAPVLSPAPAATHGEPLNPPLFTPASPARHPSTSVATPSNHPPIHRVAHFNPTYPRALNQPPKIRQSSRPGSPSPLWGLGLPGREYPHKPPPFAHETPATAHPSFPRPPRARPLPVEGTRPEPVEGACPEPVEGDSSPRPQTPPKRTPAAPQEFFGKNSYCARGPLAAPRQRRVG